MLRMLAEPGFHRAGEGTSYAIRDSSDRENPCCVPGFRLLFNARRRAVWAPMLHTTKKPEVQSTSGFYSAAPEW